MLNFNCLVEIPFQIKRVYMLSRLQREKSLTIWNNYYPQTKVQVLWEQEQFKGEKFKALGPKMW